MKSILVLVLIYFLMIFNSQAQIIERYKENNFQSNINEYCCTILLQGLENKLELYDSSYSEISYKNLEKLFIHSDTAYITEWITNDIYKLEDNILIKLPLYTIIKYFANGFDTITDINPSYIQFTAIEYSRDGEQLRTFNAFKIKRNGVFKQKGKILDQNKMEDSISKLIGENSCWELFKSELLMDSEISYNVNDIYRIKFGVKNTFSQDLITKDDDRNIEILIIQKVMSYKYGHWYIRKNNLVLESEYGIPIREYQIIEINENELVLSFHENKIHLKRDTCH